MNSEIVRKSQAPVTSIKVARQINTDREEDLVVVNSVEDAYQESSVLNSKVQPKLQGPTVLKSHINANITTQQKVMSEVLLRQKQQAVVATQISAQIENELGNLIDNDIELDDAELAEID